MITSSLWHGKRYAVLGLARSGAASVQALLASGAEVVAWDEKEEGRSSFSRHPGLDPGSSPQPEVSSQAEGWTLDQVQGDGTFVMADILQTDLTGFTAVVVSPGVPLNRHPIAAHAAKFGVPIIGDIELFAQARAELPPHKVVGITGTNGKSTTTALVHHILKTAGVPTTMGGNIGLPILAQEPLPEGGVYVLELSSYQIDLTFTLDCDVAVLLNVTPDHLDRYDGFEEYRKAKFRLLHMQDTVENKAIIGSIAMLDDTPNLVVLLALDYAAQQLNWPALRGPHNHENAACAIAVGEALGLYGQIVDDALRTYPGLPHRMERIRERNGVLFVNDSKATNADSAAPALAAYPHIRWIVGGQAKTAELDACVPHFGHVRSAYTIGDATTMFADLLRPHMSVEESGTLAAAVASAARDAQAGETVLLSPACASFDQFRNFEDRGDSFRKLVEAL